MVSDANKTFDATGLNIDSMVHTAIVGALESIDKTISILIGLETILESIHVSLPNCLANSGAKAIEVYRDCGITTGDWTNEHYTSTSCMSG